MRTNLQSLVTIASPEVGDINAAVEMLGDVDWRSCELARSRQRDAADAARLVQAKTEICHALQQRLFSQHFGHAILDATEVEGFDDDEWCRRLLVVVSSAFGRVFGAFRKHGLWKHIGVKSEVEPSRTEGTGLMLPHHDFVNARLPPDIVVLRCRRSDPGGGGASIIANIPRVLALLSGDELAILREGHAREGAYFELNGLGGELNPFPLLEVQAAACRLRFTAKLIQTIPASPLRTVVTKLNNLLLDNCETHLLRPGQALFLNQHLVCHGRTPLGRVLAPAASARSLEQIFIRLDPTPWRQDT